MSAIDPLQDQDPIEQLLLTAYPNPERKGCPGHDVLAALAGRERDPDDSNWYHVWHCSPCYAEFKEMRDARWAAERAHDRHRRRTTWIAVAAAALVLIISGSLWLQQNKQSGPIGTAQIILDLSEFDPKRGFEDNRTINLPPLPRKIDNVRIVLPRFSDEGLYTVAVLKSKDDHTALALDRSQAARDGQRLLLSVRFDLSHAAPGNYRLGTRLNGGDLISYYPLRVE